MTLNPPANPFEALLGLASGLFVSRIVWSIAEIGVADAIGDGPTPLAEIADKTGCDATNLGRMLDAAASLSLLTKTDDGYAHGMLSPLLRSDHPASQRAFVRSIFGGEHYAAWNNVEASLKRGVTAFDDQYGMPVFDWFGRNPAQAELFSHAMESSTKLAEAAILMSWSPPAFTTAMDVGGSRGTLISALLAQRPEARGIVFDLPEVVAQVAPTLAAGGRIEAVAGDFFVGVPAADLYLLKFILHDWTDDQSVTILKNIRSACAPGAHVAIIEIVLPETVAPHPGYLMDLNMMVMTGGKERTAAQFAALLEQSGFRYEGLTPTPSPFSIVSAVAV